MAELTCANHTVFLYDGRTLECSGCGQPPRPEPPKPESAATEVVEEEPQAETPDEAAAADAPETRGVGVKTPKGTRGVRSGKG